MKRLYALFYKEDGSPWLRMTRNTWRTAVGLLPIPDGHAAMPAFHREHAIRIYQDAMLTLSTRSLIKWELRPLTPAQHALERRKHDR